MEPKANINDKYRRIGDPQNIYKNIAFRVSVLNRASATYTMLCIMLQAMQFVFWDAATWLISV